MLKFLPSMISVKFSKSISMAITDTYYNVKGLLQF